MKVRILPRQPISAPASPWLALSATPWHEGADAPEELLENVCMQKWRAASAWSLLHVSPTATRHTNGTRVSVHQRAVRRKWFAERTRVLLRCHSPVRSRFSCQHGLRRRRLGWSPNLCDDRPLLRDCGVETSCGSPETKRAGGHCATAAEETRTSYPRTRSQRLASLRVNDNAGSGDACVARVTRHVPQTPTVA